MATTGYGTSTPALVAIPGSYTLGQLIARWRLHLDDTLQSVAGDYLWSNNELTSYADAVQKMLFAELPISQDRVTDSVCSVSLVQGNGAITLSSRIVRVVRAILSSQTQPLVICNADWMDVNIPGWDTQTTQGIPRYLVVSGISENSAYLYPPLLSATDTMKLSVYRLPLVDLNYAAHMSDSLEIDKYTHLINDYIYWQAYSKHDTDTEDMRKAEYHRRLWMQSKDTIKRMVLSQQPMAYDNQLPDGLC